MEKEEELKTKYYYWTDKSINQLSFFNNLLLTICIGIISLAFKDMPASEFTLCFHKINCSITLVVASLLILLFSMLIGFIVALSRIYDFKLTRNISSVKYQFYNKTHRELKSTKTRIKYRLIKRIIKLVKLLYTDISIYDTDISKFIELGKVDGFEKFDTLREITYNLGFLTWSLMNWQVVTFILGMILFFTSILFK